MRTILIIYTTFFLCNQNVVAQVSLADAKRIENTLYNVLDKNVGQMFSFIKVSNYLDGSKMEKSKCDNVMYIQYQNEFFKRVYEGGLNIRWFGCNETAADNQVIINQVLARYKTAYIPSGVFKTAGTITVPEKAELQGAGNNAIIKLISKTPLAGINVNRWGSLLNFKLDCSSTDMDLSPAILLKSWDQVYSNTGESTFRNLVVVGNYPQLQGVGIKLEITPAPTKDYSVIVFCKFSNIDIYGFRDGIFLDLQYQKGKNISYINANIFENIIIHRCLRPLRLINTAEAADVVSGKSAIATNYFKQIIIQHVVGDFPAIYLDGAGYNDISAQISDWTGNHVEATSKSLNNAFSILPADPGKIKQGSPAK